MSLRITLLGTGSPIPDPNRAGPSTLVQGAGTTLLVDAGRGVLMRLAAAGVMPPMLDAVLLTHLHSDHICDLNDVITTHWVLSMAPTTLRIVGPSGTRVVVDGILASLGPDIGYRLAHHDDLTEGPQLEITEVAPGDRVELGAATVTVGATDHRPVEPSVGFRVDQDGASAVLAGDTVPCDALDELCREAGVYVQTVIRDDVIAAIPMRRLQDIVDYHSSVAQAARTAERAGVDTLVLTHYVPAPPPGEVDEWVAIAAEHFGGRIVAGEDLTAVETRPRTVDDG